MVKGIFVSRRFVGCDASPRTHDIENRWMQKFPKSIVLGFSCS